LILQIADHLAGVRSSEEGLIASISASMAKDSDLQPTKLPVWCKACFLPGLGVDFC